MKRRLILVIVILCALLTGCAKKSDNNSNSSNTTTASETSSEQATETITETTTESAKVEPPKVELILPIVENTSGKVRIQTVAGVSAYPHNSYIITSINGESIVVDPTNMPDKEMVDINPAAIVSTHDHSDHVDPDYTDSYDCQKILYTIEDINTEDFHIYTIASSHSGDKTIDETTKNVIIVFEVDGLRIAHMGDIGQTTLTQDQLKGLGEIDIAFMQFENSYSSMTLFNETGFTMIEQLNPKIIIPTHFTYNALPVLEEKYGTITEFENILEITKEELPEKALTVFRILNRHRYR